MLVEEGKLDLDTDFTEYLPEFDTGGALIYNNSAYFLLGLIIEKVSGQPYGEFVAERIFEPLGMESSYYCSETAVREHRAHGYDGTPGGLIRKRYLDHTWPFAAGSLCSSAGDLVRWNQALHGGRVLPPASYQELVTPCTLSSAVAGLILGPPPALEAVPFEGDLEELVGSYTGPARGLTLTMEVSAEEDQLVFTVQGIGRVTELHLDQVSGHYVLKREGG